MHPVPNWIDASAKTLPLPRMPKLIAACEFNYLETYRAMFGKCFARFVAADETFELIRVKGCRVEGSGSGFWIQGLWI